MTLRECQLNYPNGSCLYYKNYSNFVCIISGYVVENNEAYPAYRVSQFCEADVFIPIKDIDDNFFVR